MKKLIFLGTNSVLERYIEACERQGQEIHGIIDSDWFGNRKTFAGLDILDSEEIFKTDPLKYKDYVFFIGTNWNPNAGRDILKRKMFLGLVEDYNLTCVNLIDPTSYVSRFAKLGQGIFIGSNCYIEPNCIIGDYVSIYGGNGLGHDTHVGTNTVLQRESKVHAKIGSNCYIGIGTCVIRDPSITVGDGAVISPCLHVARDVASNEHVTMSKSAFRVYRDKNEST